MAELTIRPDEIRDALANFVQAYEPGEASRQEVGTVAECGDGSELPAALDAAGEVDVVVMDLRMREVDGITRSYRPGVPMYAAATVVGIFQAEVSAGLYAAIALFYVLSSSLFGREEVLT